MSDDPELIPSEPTKVAAPQSDDDKKLKARSPAYPAIGLRRALELASKLWESEKRQFVLVTRATVATGFSAKSGHGVAALSAMIKFGLLADEGSGQLRKVKLTDTAISLLNPSTSNKEQLLKTCALAPTIHGELWKKFGADGGSDGAIHDYLTFERGFFPEAAKTLIGEYKDTITFAKLTEADKVETSEKEQAPENLLGGEILPPSPPPFPNSSQQKGSENPPSAPAIQPTSLAKQTPPLDPALKYYPIPTDIGDAWIPMGMSEDDFTLLGEALKLFKKKIVKASRFPAAAIWRNADQDKPIMVVGEEEKDGAKYYITQSGTGIPENEVYFA